MYCAVQYFGPIAPVKRFVYCIVKKGRFSGLMHVIPKKRGRGRPRSFDIDAALDCAVEVFWKNGYEGADLSVLTEAMGINRPSLYVAYGDKRALFFKAVERYYRTVARVPLPAATRREMPRSVVLYRSNSRSFLSPQAIAWLSHRLRACRPSQCERRCESNSQRTHRAGDTAPRELGVYLPFRGTRCHESPMPRQSVDSDAPHGCY